MSVTEKHEYMCSTWSARFVRCIESHYTAIASSDERTTEILEIVRSNRADWLIREYMYTAHQTTYNLKNELRMYDDWYHLDAVAIVKRYTRAKSRAKSRHGFGTHEYFTALDRAKGRYHAQMNDASARHACKHADCMARLRTHLTHVGDMVGTCQFLGFVVALRQEYDALATISQHTWDYMTDVQRWMHLYERSLMFVRYMSVLAECRAICTRYDRMYTSTFNTQLLSQKGN